MKKYLIENMGCDDETDFEIELTDEELEIILKFIKLNNENATGHCQPVIGIYKDYFYRDGIPTHGIYINDEYLYATSLLEENSND
jgi:hypothetical protein